MQRGERRQAAGPEERCFAGLRRQRFAPVGAVEVGNAERGGARSGQRRAVALRQAGGDGGDARRVRRGEGPHRDDQRPAKASSGDGRPIGAKQRSLNPEFDMAQANSRRRQGRLGAEPAADGEGDDIVAPERRNLADAPHQTLLVNEIGGQIAAQVEIGGKRGQGGRAGSPDRQQRAGGRVGATERLEFSGEALGEHKEIGLHAPGRAADRQAGEAGARRQPDVATGLERRDVRHDGSGRRRPGRRCRSRKSARSLQMNAAIAATSRGSP